MAHTELWSSWLVVEVFMARSWSLRVSFSSSSDVGPWPTVGISISLSSALGGFSSLSMLSLHRNLPVVLTTINNPSNGNFCYHTSHDAEVSQSSILESLPYCWQQYKGVWYTCLMIVFGYLSECCHVIPTAFASSTMQTIIIRPRTACCSVADSTLNRL